MIASKYEEIYAPEVNDFVYITDGAYTKENILDCENEILTALEFNLSAPSSLHFLRRFSKAANSEYTVHTLCKYLCEVCLMDVKLAKYLPSQIAAGSVYLARAMTHSRPLWDSTLEHYTTYSAEKVRRVACDINNLLKHLKNASLQSIHKKYCTAKFSEVALLPLVEL